MFEWTRLATFMLTAGLLIVVPGPAVLYVVARSVDQGRLAGIVSVLGIALGSEENLKNGLSFCYRKRRFQ